VHSEVVGDVVSSGLVGNSTSVEGRVVYGRHGDVQVASAVRDPDVLVVVGKQARTVAQPDAPRRRHSVSDAVQSVGLTGDHRRRQVRARLVNSCRN